MSIGSNSFLLHIPKPIKAMPKSYGYTDSKPRPVHLLYRPAVTPLSDDQLELASERRLEWMAEVEKELGSRGVRGGRQPQRSHTELTVPERPSNPLERDRIFREECNSSSM
eukprot:TRINITY_DN6416_c0_g1_i12.p2 TRINITY_DN6416_c0_g1~~TRINITY_DN6416_c0_g1_i12.p2  ORF type:complete len:111 (+),score=4.87 TRINITY_DN6416_c0_g1_i12:179-511(+)